jgi:hypothetical protein
MQIEQFCKYLRHQGFSDVDQTVRPERSKNLRDSHSDFSVYRCSSGRRRDCGGTASDHLFAVDK